MRKFAKISAVLAAMVFALAFVGCLGVSKSVIRSPDGSQKVDLIGTWKAKESDGYFKMIFDNNGSLTYGCRESGGPARISMDSFGDVVSYNEFNVWFSKGTFKTHGNILTAHWEETKDFFDITSLRAGSNEDFVVNIVSPDKLIIQNSSTGSTRTYIRQ